jgi:hypothetical protein
VRGVVLVNAAGKFEEVKKVVEAPVEAALQGAGRDAAAPPLREVPGAPVLSGGPSATGGLQLGGSTELGAQGW